MLTSLLIKDVVLIDRLELQPQNGLNVFTGETGAGKSILLDSLALALGARSDASLVRYGADSLCVTASFAVQPGHPAANVLLANEIGFDGEIILRRIVNSDGKSKAFVNDTSVTLGLLKEVGDKLCEIHGQFANHALLNPANHAGMLDAYGDISGLAAASATAFKAWQAASQALQQQKALIEKAAADEEYVRFSLESLQKINPAAGEESELLQQKKLLVNGQKLSDLLTEAANVLDGKVLADAAKAGRILDKVNIVLEGSFDGKVAELDQAVEGLRQVCSAVEDTLSQLDFSPARLEQIDDRIYALREQARKHRCTVDELPAMLEKLEEQLRNLTDGQLAIGDLQAKVDNAWDEFAAIAARLSDARAKAARELDKGVNGMLASLKLEKAKFITEITALPQQQWGAGGAEKVVFLANTNPTQPAGAINKIASGGELARFMLAIKANLLAAMPVVTVVFDEVDSGVGGAVALAVGKVLESLGKSAQILVVTHSHQVASVGASHFKVIKTEDMRTTVQKLDDTARNEEIARMLSGQDVTDEARAAAGKLLSG
ncbi:MAG: DNA repair protein RecN [Alphaproteobacteria bacterium]|nr:DNA repair protein RecN [Alphaproteobacteria bacterium]